jgi:hypothetical protein
MPTFASGALRRGMKSYMALSIRSRGNKKAHASHRPFTGIIIIVIIYIHIDRSHQNIPL